MTPEQIEAAAETALLRSMAEFGITRAITDEAILTDLAAIFRASAETQTSTDS